MRFVCVCALQRRLVVRRAATSTQSHTHTHSLSQRSRSKERKFPGWENQGSLTIRSCDKQQRYHWLCACKCVCVVCVLVHACVSVCHISLTHKQWWVCQKKGANKSWITNPLYAFVLTYTHISSSVCFLLKHTQTWASATLSILLPWQLCSGHPYLMLSSHSKGIAKSQVEKISHRLRLCRCTWHFVF